MNFEQLADYNGEAAAFFEARSRLWKRAAKKYRGLCLEFCEYVDAQATADRLVAENARRLGKLIKAHEECIRKGWCPFCTMTEVDTFWGHEHDPDCSLAKELADE